MTRPQIKYLKSQVPDILSGAKTLDPRPRSPQWIDRIENAGTVNLTWGPRFKPPQIFAIAKIEKIEIRPFETIKEEDIPKIGSHWVDKTKEDFIKDYSEWYAKELAKGYPVAWIYFRLINSNP